MTRQRPLVLASLLAAWAGMVLACAGGGRPISVAGEKQITYEVLKENRRIDGKILLDILVSEQAPKEDVMKLAESLWQRNDIDTLRVFDSREIYEATEWERVNLRDHPKYTDKEMRLHYLVWAMDLTAGGGKRELHWNAEGRVVDEQKSSQDRQKELAARKAKAQLELPALREALTAAQNEQTRTSALKREADKAAAEARNLASQDAAAYMTASKMYDRLSALGSNAVGPQERETARNKYRDAKQRAIESKQRAEDLDANAKHFEPDAKQAAAALAKAKAAVQQAEQDAR